MNSTGTVGNGTELAAEADFQLGGLVVSPSTGRAHAKSVGVRVEPRVMEVLLTLWRSAEKTVTRDQLVEACWSGRAVTDDAIGRAIAKVRQLAHTGGEVHFTIETLPKVGFRLVPGDAKPSDVRTLARPALTISGILQKVDAVIPARSLQIVAFAAIIAALAGAVVVFWSLGASRNGGDTLAVNEVQLSPFGALRNEPTLKRLSIRARQAVARRLSAEGLQPRFADDPNATHGDAEYTVSGALDHDDRFYTAWISVVDQSDQTVAWSDKFESGGNNGDGLDEQVGSAVAAVMKCGARERRAHPEMTKPIFSQYLSACGDVHSDRHEGLQSTQRLLAMSPDDSGALGLRALTLASRAEDIDQFADKAAAMAKEAKTTAERALALDPNNATALMALGFRLGDEPRFAERERALKRARELDPALARLQYIMLLREVGRLRAAVEIAETIDEDVEPRLKTLPQVAFLYATAGDLPAAHRVLDRMEIVRPDDTPIARWTVSFWWDDPRRMTDQFWEVIRKQEGETRAACSRLYISSLLARGSAPVRGLPRECSIIERDWQIRMLTREGDIDGAYEIVKTELPHSRRRMMFLFYPEMKAFRDDPRFLKLTEQLGLLAYWRETGQWPDFCADEAPALVCR